jgi:hypothetical protein
MYSAHEAFAIEDDIKRGVYLINYFWDNNAQVIDNRISEWIELHENGTFIESSENYAQSLVNMIIILHKYRNQIRNYNLLVHTALITMYQMGTKEDAWVTLTGLTKDDFPVWIRRKKIVSLMDKIKND